MENKHSGKIITIGTFNESISWRFIAQFLCTLIFKRRYNRLRTEMILSTLDSLDLVLLPGYAIVVVAGLIGNSLILTVVKNKRYMHTTTNFLLANLAFADLLTLLWCIPGVALQHSRHPDGILGDLFCKFITMNHLAGISLLVAGLTLTLVSVERYNALLNPLNASVRLNKENVRYPIVIMWIFGFIYVLPLFVVERFDEVRRQCVFHWQKASSTVYWSLLAMIVVIAFFVVCFCYFNIIRGLYFTKKICAETSTLSSQAAEEIQAKRKIAKLSITITIIFIACFFPYVAATVLDASLRSSFYRISLFLVYCSCCVNPMCYALQSSNYRTAFKETIKRKSSTHQNEQAV